MKRQKHYIVRTFNNDGSRTEIALGHGEPYSYSEAEKAARLSASIYNAPTSVLVVTPRGIGGRTTCLKKFPAHG